VLYNIAFVCVEGLSAGVDTSAGAGSAPTGQHQSRLVSHRWWSHSSE